MMTKTMVMGVLILCVMVFQIQCISADATDCLDACTTGCVQRNSRLQQRCDRKCSIKCGPDSQVEKHANQVIRE